MIFIKFLLLQIYIYIYYICNQFNYAIQDANNYLCVLLKFM